MMMNIQFESLFPWLQKKYEQKYGAKLQLLRKTFLVFYNLTQQIIEIYNNIYEQTTKLSAFYQYSSDEQLEALRVVVQRTIIILHRLSQNQNLVNNKPGAIDLTFCERFIRNFGENLNILCTYYHSLNHCEIVSNKFKFEKKKIVEGINRLYSVHNKIRELFLKNDIDLKNIENQKQYILANISHIYIERQVLYKSTRVIFNTVEQQTADFYDCFQQMMKYAKNTNSMVQGNNSENSAQQTIKKLMKNYFRILHQFYETQAELEYYLKPILNFCEQIKNKKKTMNYTVADAINTFSRITSQLLKSNYSLKNLKKIRMEQLNKALFILLEQIISSNVGIDFKQSSQFLGHKIFKQLGIGIYGYEQKELKQKEKMKEKQKEKQKQKQKEKQKQKQKEKQKNKNKDKGKQKERGNQKSYSQKQINVSGSKTKGSLSPLHNVITGKAKQSKQKLIQQQIDLSNQQQQQYQIDIQRKSENEEIKQYHHQKQTPQQKIQMVVDEISQCSSFIMDCMKELQKVQNSGLLNMIQQYKQKLNVSTASNTTQNTNANSQNTNSSQWQNSKKLITKLCEYQKYISDYYKLHESIKEFQKILREIVLEEFNVKINVNITMELDQYQLELLGLAGNQKELKEDSSVQISSAKNKRKQ